MNVVVTVVFRCVREMSVTDRELLWVHPSGPPVLFDVNDSTYVRDFPPYATVALLLMVTLFPLTTSVS